MNNPTQQEITKTRKEAGLTQTQAAELIYKKLRTWQQWENGDREMDYALWELFNIKLGEILKIPK
ncbi:MAG: helix-turn-helix transcriptional regulator [Methylococcaceae bacterium]|nr:helix-turn-helix transcriptional regulator [Methylococcaceae bacterium]